MKRILLLFISLIATVNLNATIITVTNNLDGGAFGTFRQAVSIAVDGDTIDFAYTAPDTIVFSSGQILVNKSLTIIGTNNLVFNGNGTDRLLEWDSNTTTFNVSISGITFINGSTVSGTSGCRNGGAISFHGRGHININDCIFKNNFSNCSGGAICFNSLSSDCKIDRCQFENNSSNVSTGTGGAIVAYYCDSLLIRNSTFQNNNGGSGGAISSYAKNLIFENLTLFENIANINGSAFCIFDNSNCNALIKSCTIKNNMGANGVSAVYVMDINPPFSTGNIIFVNNIFDNPINFGTYLFGSMIAFNSDGSNISSDNTFAPILTQTGDLNNTNPLLDLAGLQNNGGFTNTIALQNNSPAINAGNSVMAPTFDQRGFPRVGNPDIGSYEEQLNIGLDDHSTNFNISLSPNPTNGLLELNSTKSLINACVKIINLQGEIVMENPKVNGYKTVFQMNNLANGVYFIEIRNGEDFTRLKVVKD